MTLTVKYLQTYTYMITEMTGMGAYMMRGAQMMPQQKLVVRVVLAAVAQEAFALVHGRDPFVVHVPFGIDSHYLFKGFIVAGFHMFLEHNLAFGHETAVLTFDFFVFLLHMDG